MISANSLVFPKPKLTDVRPIERHLVYIPKDITSKHFYSNDKAVDDLTCVGSPTSRSIENPVSKMFQLRSMKMLRTKKGCPSGYIPCVYLKGSYHDNKLVIYFHSNGEDIITAFGFAQAINSSSGRSVLMVEYPGYSIYRPSCTKSDLKIGKGNFYQTMSFEQTTAEEIQRDAAKVIQYMKGVAGYSLKDITVLGRSIGSGPAVYVASIYAIGALVLLSPFISLCQAVKDLYGQLCSRLLKERFNNKERVKLIECPTLLIHGLEDTIIPCSHSVTLNKQFKSFSTLKLIQKMKHNSFHFHRQFLVHVKEFLRNIQLYQ